MNIKIYNLRHQFRCVPLLGLDRSCRAHPSPLFVESVACAHAEVVEVESPSASDSAADDST